jgi:ribosomal protein S18 acetylase RimI-like enzyme
MSIRVRAATVADYEAAGAICVAAYRAAGQLSAGANDYGTALADVASRAGQAEILVAVDEQDDVLGCVTFAEPGTVWAELSQPNAPEFRMLAVAPSAQGRGVGSALVTACLERAAELGYPAVVICVRDFVESAKRLYARMGFVRMPELDWSPAPDVHLEALRFDLRQVPAVPVVPVSSNSSATASPAS